MRYHLRTLLFVLALGPPLLAGGWLTYSAWRERQSAAPPVAQKRLIYFCGGVVSVEPTEQEEEEFARLVEEFFAQMQNSGQSADSTPATLNP